MDDRQCTARRRIPVPPVGHGHEESDGEQCQADRHHQRERKEQADQKVADFIQIQVHFHNICPGFVLAFCGRIRLAGQFFRLLSINQSINPLLRRSSIKYKK